MSDYTKTVNFAAKDALISGDPNKVIQGTEINTEFANIATAVATKADKASPTFTGTVTTAAVLSSIDDAAASAVTDVLTVQHTTSGTAGNGIGSGIAFSAETLGGNHTIGTVDFVTTDVTDTSEDADFVVNLMAGGSAAAEAFRVASTGVVTATGNIVSDTDSTDDLGTTGVRWANLYVDDIITTTSAAISTLVLSTGSIADTSGAISFNNENLSGSGTLAFTGGGSLTGTWSDLGTVTTVDINGGTIDGAVIGGAAAAAGTFTNLTASTDLTLASGATVTAILDEDTMTSDSATALATQQSIKAYVDASVAGGGVATSGTPVANDFARFTDANTIEGRSYAEVRADLSLEVGTDVQAYDADILKADTADQLTAAFTEAVDDDGTQSTGTYTPSVSAGSNAKKIVNNGAFTLAPPSPNNDEAICLSLFITNGASAGAITTSGFTNTTGDAFDTTNGNDFLCRIEVYDIGGTEYSNLDVVALQ